MSAKKSILFVGGGIETLPGIKIARDMGLNVIVSDINPEAPGVNASDHFIHADTYDENTTLRETLKFQRKFGKIDAVMCMATDVPLTVATVSEELDIAGIPLFAALTVSDKILMKNCFKKHGLPIPWYTEVYDFYHFKEIIKERGRPLIIKPVDSRGARGVLLVKDKIDLKWAYEASIKYSPSKRVMVETYLSGPQVSTEALVVDGDVFTVGVSDRNYEFLDRYAPHIIENGGDLPSCLPDNDLEKLIQIFEKSAKSLGIYNGVIKGDMVLSKGKPFIIEVAARLSGGYFCSHEIPLNTGVEFVKLAIETALGDPIDVNALQPVYNRPVSQRYLFPRPGVVTEIIVPSWIEKHQDIELLEIRVKVGDEISNTEHHPSRAGLVITTGPTRSEAISLAEKVVNCVCIRTQ